MIAVSQLNQVAELIGSNDKSVVISTVIKFLVDEGADLESAYNAVFGEGSYAKLANSVYEKM